MCPCPQNDNQFTVALLAAAAIVMAVGVARNYWPTATWRVRLGVVGVAILFVGGSVALIRYFDKAECVVGMSSTNSEAGAWRDIARSPSRELVPAESQPSTPVVNKEQPLKIIAYYFHRTARCHSCLTIEEYARQAIETGFALELQDGVVEWRPVNIEQKGNEHFEIDYSLSAQSLVVVKIENGKQAKWKTLSKVWDLLGDPTAFAKYVQGELRTYLDEEMSDLPLKSG